MIGVKPERAAKYKRLHPAVWSRAPRFQPLMDRAVLSIFPTAVRGKVGQIGFAAGDGEPAATSSSREASETPRFVPIRLVAEPRGADADDRRDGRGASAPARTIQDLARPCPQPGPGPARNPG